MNKYGIRMLTPMEVAAIELRMCGALTSPDRIAVNYRANAETMRDYAKKAAAHKTGKYRGYTADEASASAAECEARAISVPAALKELLGASA